MLRINGDMITPSEDIISSSELREFANETLSENQKKRLEEVRDVDLAFEIDNCRFRANFFYTSDGLSAVLRKIETEIPSMRELGIPFVMQEIVEKPSGLVLITGPTGSGKSTSLAAIIDAINDTKKGHILTIEDPIEYIHHSKKMQRLSARGGQGCAIICKRSSGLASRRPGRYSGWRIT